MKQCMDSWMQCKHVFQLMQINIHFNVRRSRSLAYLLQLSIFAKIVQRTKNFMLVQRTYICVVMSQGSVNQFMHFIASWEKLTYLLLVCSCWYRGWWSFFHFSKIVYCCLQIICPLVQNFMEPIQASPTTLFPNNGYLFLQLYSSSKLWRSVWHNFPLLWVNAI